MLQFESHTKPEKIVAGAWFVTQVWKRALHVFAFGFMVSAWCFATDLRKHSDQFVVGQSGAPGVAFDVVWTSLMVIATALIGGMVLPLWTRKYTTPVHYGVLMGVWVTMISVMLMTAVRYGKPSSAYHGVSHWSSTNATAAFAALLCLSQIALTTFAAAYKHSILKETPYANDAQSVTPHPQPQPAVTTFTPPPSQTRSSMSSAFAPAPAPVTAPAPSPSKLGAVGRNPFPLFAAEHAAADPYGGEELRQYYRQPSGAGGLGAGVTGGAVADAATSSGNTSPIGGSPSVGASAMLAAHFSSPLIGRFPATTSAAAAGATSTSPTGNGGLQCAALQLPSRRFDTVACSGAAVERERSFAESDTARGRAAVKAPSPPTQQSLASNIASASEIEAANTTFATPLTTPARTIQPHDMPQPSAPLPTAASPTATPNSAPPFHAAAHRSASADSGLRDSAESRQLFASRQISPPTPTRTTESPAPFESVPLR